MGHGNRLVAVLFLTFAPLGAFCLTSPVAAQLSDRKDTIRVLILKEFPPQFVSTPDGPSGLAVEVMREVAQRASLKIEYVSVDAWPKVYLLLKNGSVDALANMGISEARQKIVEFTEPYEVFDIKLFVRTETTDIDTYDDLNGRVLGTLSTNVLTKDLVNSGKYKIKTYPSFQAILLGLLSGEIDAVPAPTEPFLLIARGAHLDDRIKPVGLSLREVKRAIAVPKGRIALRDRLNKGLMEFKQTNDYQAMLSKWYGTPTPYWTVIRILYLMGAILIVSISIMATWRYYSILALNKRIRINEENLQTASETLSAINTELKRANASLSMSEDRFSRAVAGADEGIWDWNIKTGENYFSPRFEQILGYDEGELNPVVETLQNHLHPEDQKRTSEAIQSHLDDRVPYDIEFRLRCKDGEYKWVYVKGQAVWDEQGDATMFAGAITDISRRMLIEEQLRQAQKMEAVGQLTGGIAHDFNNMLGIIMGNLDLLRRKVVGDVKAIEFVEAAYRGSQRGADITKKLLSFARGGAGTPQITNVNDFITDMKNLIAKSLTPKVDIETHLADDIWVVNIDVGELENTLLNLSLNASDAMPEGGILVIETSNKVLDEHYVQMNPGSMAGEYVLVSISDTGIGMAPEVTHQIFQPFFTTKESGRGTGLGLSMVYGFVQRSGGHIKVYSEPDKGSTFRMYFPRAVEGSHDVKDTKSAIDDSLPRGEETVLIVDDEEGLLKVAALYLGDLGYKTRTASSSKLALRQLQQVNQIDLLFSDVVMPGGMDGYDLAKAALKSCPDLKVLLTSGFTSKRENAINGDVAMFARLSENLLNKPYNQSELAVAVRSALDGDA